MGKKATKASDNMYCIARYEAEKNREELASREKASEILGIERTRLARIELGNVVPYPDEILQMSKVYDSPELCNAYCALECPIGKKTITKVTMDDFDRLALKVLGSLKNIDDLRKSLIAISEDGVIEKNEQSEFNRILESLEKVSNNAKALKLWAEKNVKIEEAD